MNEETLKHCPRCNRDKPSEEFGKNRSSKDGLQTYCKSCVASYRESHRAELRASARAWYHRNKDTARSRAKEYADEHREAIRKRNREYYHKKKSA